MLRVLFIDDEVNALDAMRRILRPKRELWEMRFLSDPGAALQATEEFEPEVVVADLRMPRLDGVALFSELARRGSSAIRIMLSGVVSERAIVDALGVANQVLVKPVAPGALEDAITRANELKTWLARPEVSAAVAECEPLPTLPRVYHEFVEAVRKEASLAEVGAIAAQDPAITARLLQIANSACFAPRHPIVSVPLATAFLGLEIVRPIVLFAAMDGPGNGDPAVVRRLESIWSDSTRVAHAARAIALAEGMTREVAAAAFSLGILHDVGALAMSRRRDTIDTGELAEAGGDAASADDVERRSCGISHCDIGARILRSWKLPDDAVAVAAWHHDARRLCSGDDSAPALLVAASCALQTAVDAGGETVEVARLRQALARRGGDRPLDRWREVAAGAGRVAV